MRGASILVRHISSFLDFNPRSPCGERQAAKIAEIINEISIHAPHAGSDPWIPSAHMLTEFQSTLPMRGATIIYDALAPVAIISIHAPHAGSEVKQKTLNPCGIQHIILRTS